MLSGFAGINKEFYVSKNILELITPCSVGFLIGSDMQLKLKNPHLADNETYLCSL
jgi:hypothetical protein